MHTILGDLVGKFIVIYLDDILIFSQSEEEHEEHLRVVLQRLRDHKLTLNLNKCTLFVSEIKFLGHIISAQGIRVNEEKVKAIKDWPEPTSSKDVQRFLGLANYFRRFIQGYSSLAAPLTHLASRNLKRNHFAAVYTDSCKRAFSGIKHALMSAPVLAHPNPDLPYRLVVDASLNGTGAILMQNHHPIAYHSHKFTTTERNYSAGEQELLAVVLALTEFRCYVQGCAGGLTVDTDHSPNTFLPTVQMMPRKKARWAEFLSEFHFTWNHIPGRVNVADPLSRRPDFEQPASCAALLTERVHDDDPSLATHVHDLIRDAYQHDAWFQDPKHVQTFELRNGLYHGTEPADS
jgi:hypothetical protein